MEIKIRDAVAADLAVPVVGGSAGEYVPQLTRHLDLAAKGLGAVLVAEADGSIVGRGFIERWGKPQCAWLGGLVVDPEHQRQGIATALLAAAEARTLALGYRSLYLTVGKQNDRALPLYDKNGYRRIGEDRSSGLVAADGTVVHPAEPVWVMRKVLVDDDGEEGIGSRWPMS